MHDKVSLVQGNKETDRTNDHQNRPTHTWKHYWGKRFNNGTHRQLKVERQMYQTFRRKKQCYIYYLEAIKHNILELLV